MSDRRYSTSAWQRTRRAVLRRDGEVCAFCGGHATTVHHIVASSERPDLFWSMGNLASACTKCNYGHGARLKNGHNRQTIAALQELVEQQSYEIERLRDQLEQLQPAPPLQKPRAPAIY